MRERERELALGRGLVGRPVGFRLWAEGGMGVELAFRLGAERRRAWAWAQGPGPRVLLAKGASESGGRGQL